MIIVPQVRGLCRGGARSPKSKVQIQTRDFLEEIKLFPVRSLKIYPQGYRKTQKDPEKPRRTQKDPKGPKRTTKAKKDPVRLSKPRQTSQAAFAASISFSSWFLVHKKLRYHNLDTQVLTVYLKVPPTKYSWMMKKLSMGFPPFHLPTFWTLQYMSVLSQ